MAAWSAVVSAVGIVIFSFSLCGLIGSDCGRGAGIRLTGRGRRTARAAAGPYPR